VDAALRKLEKRERAIGQSVGLGAGFIAIGQWVGLRFAAIEREADAIQILSPQELGALRSRW